MAIVVEEQRQSKIPIFYILGWMIFLLFVIIGIYYVFFKKPEVYIQITSGKTTSPKNMENLTKINSLVDWRATFQKISQFKEYVAIPQNIPAGKEDPFF